MRGSADRDQRNLLEIGIVVILIRFTFCGSNLLNGGTRRHDRSEILTVNFIKCWPIGQVVQIYVCCDHLTKIHPCFFEVVGGIGLGRRRWWWVVVGLTAACWPGDKAVFGGEV